MAPPTLTPLFDLSGKTALVTGSSRGIGLAIAMALAEHGANVIIHYNKNKRMAEKAAKAARKAFQVEAQVVQANLAEDNGVDQLWQSVNDGLGAPDILVLNASTQIECHWDETRIQDWKQQSTTNLESTIQLCQHAIQPMRDTKWGRILAIGSTLSTQPSHHLMAYSATKAAQENVMRLIAKRERRYGITANTLSPGLIETDRTSDFLKDTQKVRHFKSKTGVQRIGQPYDCAGAALLRCSDAGAYITGNNLTVSGGLEL